MERIGACFKIDFFTPHYVTNSIIFAHFVSFVIKSIAFESAGKRGLSGLTGRELSER
jgi:hypothetical protein